MLKEPKLGMRLNNLLIGANTESKAELIVVDI